MISHLEEEWNLKLFSRTPAGTFITAEGEKYLNLLVESFKLTIS